MGSQLQRTPPFVDGKKRTAFASMIAFLGLNGIDLGAPREEPAAIVFSRAEREIPEDILAGWIAAHTAPVVAPGIVPEASIFE
jgi:death-on-curing protein